MKNILFTLTFLIGTWGVIMAQCKHSGAKHCISSKAAMVASHQSSQDAMIKLVADYENIKTRKNIETGEVQYVKLVSHENGNSEYQVVEYDKVKKTFVNASPKSTNKTHCSPEEMAKCKKTCSPEQMVKCLKSKSSV